MHCRRFLPGIGQIALGWFRPQIEQSPLRRDQSQPLSLPGGYQIVFQRHGQVFPVHLPVELLGVRPVCRQFHGVDLPSQEVPQEGIALPEQQRQKGLEITGQA